MRGMPIVRLPSTVRAVTGETSGIGNACADAFVFTSVKLAVNLENFIEAKLDAVLDSSVQSWTRLGGQSLPT